MKSKKFWIVWCEAHGNPTYKHATEEDAKREAERLARRYGGNFHVLQLIGTVERDDVKWNEPKSEPESEQSQATGYAHHCDCTGDEICRHCRRRQVY